MVLNEYENRIVKLIGENPGLSSSEIHESLNSGKKLLTTKRYLSLLYEKQILRKEGKARATRYFLSEVYSAIKYIDVDEYFVKDINEREINSEFNFNFLDNILLKVEIFTDDEKELLASLHKKYLENISTISSTLYKKDLHRLGIDLSWKSSQIEGNTYSLLETEQLINEKVEAKGKKKEEAVMLLNHKKALDYIVESPNFYLLLDTKKILEVHSLLVEGLSVEKKIRNRIIGITGTNYRPLANEFQIKEALEQTCKIVNTTNSVYEKAFILLILLSYIQAFEDGNKRTARLISNAVLISNNYCPISFRTVDSIDYKKAMLLFYEQNNISAMKKIFIEQFKFAVDNYFL